MLKNDFFGFPKIKWVFLGKSKKVVSHAKILNKISYAISAWYGFLNKSHVSQINSLFKHAFKYGYVKTVFNLEQLLQNYDDNLLTKATNENHAMHHLPASFKSTCYNLQSHGHGLSVSLVKSELHKNIYQQFYLVSIIRFLCLINY